jgi:pimeloyl-ACP methyl ester carboxylesterase
VFGAERDSIIRVAQARRLAASLPQAKFHLIPGGHNDWSMQSQVSIHNP